MVFGFGMKDDASALKASYTAKIQGFFDEVDPPSSYLQRQRRRYNLESVFGWGKYIWQEKNRLENQLNIEFHARQNAEGEVNKLKQALHDAERKIQYMEHENRSMAVRHNDQIAKLTEQHQKSLDDERKILAKTISTHDKDKKASHQRYKDDLQNKQNAHEKKINQLNEEKTKLVGQLLVNQVENQGWTDDVLKLKYRELQRLIETVTSPTIRELQLPQNQVLGTHLDPTNFISRRGKRGTHFLVKSVIWAIFRDQFFSMPFGFGVLGPGNGQRELISVYSTWQKLFTRVSGLASSIGEDFAVFHRDKLANRWRSATFQCIEAALATTDGRISPPDSPIAQLDKQNINQTVSRVMAVLSEVARLSGGLVRDDLEDEIRHMANLAHSIGLQCGVHCAQLQLFTPNSGDEIQIGADFHDCEDGDSMKGSVYEVDLAIVPGLRKIGDGRSDMSSKRTIVPCEIYPDLPT